MSKARRKGTAGENKAVEFLRDELGEQVERRTQAGRLDRGDIAGIEGVVIEVKWCADLRLGEFMREAEVEAVTAGMALPILFHNRRGARTRNNYATCPWWVMRHFLRLHLEDLARRRAAKGAA